MNRTGLPVDRRLAGSYKQVWILAYPAILTMISQTVMWTVDSAMVGHIGKTELAAVGLGGILVFTLSSFFVGLTSAVNIFVAQSFGAGSGDAQRRGTAPANGTAPGAGTAGGAAVNALGNCGMYLWQGLYVSVTSGVLIYLVYAFAPQVVDLLGPGEDVRPLTTGYIQIRLLSAPFFLIYNTYSHFYRGIGDTKTPLKVILFAQVVNLAGDYFLIFGKGPFPEMGVDGAAWATALANVVAAVSFFALMFSPTLRRIYGTLDRKRLQINEIARMFRVGLPVAIHFFLDMGSFLVFSAYIGRMGTEALAVNQIAIQILALSFMPCQGFAIAATTLMGQYIGAGRPDLAEKAAYTTLKMGLFFTGFIALLCLTIPEYLVKIFNNDPMVVHLGRRVLYLAALFQVFDAVQFISSGALRGAADTRAPMWIAVGGAWVLFLPLAYVFGSVLDKGVIGAWAGATAYIIAIGVLMFVRLKMGRWKSIRL